MSNSEDEKNEENEHEPVVEDGVVKKIPNCPECGEVTGVENKRTEEEEGKKVTVVNFKCPNCGFSWTGEFEEEEEDEGCFIATAAFGTPLAKELDLFRDFRDNILKENILGYCLVKQYYEVSPPIAKIISKSERLQRLVKIPLNSIAKALK